MLPAPSGVDYKAVFRSDEFFNFEETAPVSINVIYQHNELPMRRIDSAFADLSALSYAFQLDIPDADFTKKGTRTHKQQMVFQFKDGRVLGHELSKNRSILTTEYLYVHFKRRKMTVSDNISLDNFMITPSGFLPTPSEITYDYIEEHGRGKWPDPLWLQGKKRALSERLNNE